MLDDSDVHWHRQIKAAVGGVTAAVTGDPAVFVSVSAAHQGPDGRRPGRRDRRPRLSCHLWSSRTH